MAELETLPPGNMGSRLRRFAIETPRLLMSWEDWLTLLPALVVYLSIAIAIQQADWVRDFPSLAPTVIGGLVIGLLAARTRASQFIVHPSALLFGLMLLTLTASPYGDGGSIVSRVDDIVARMNEWVVVVRENDVSTDNLPFVLLVHALGVLISYLAAWAVFRWRNIWLAVVPACAGLLVIIATTKGQPSGAFLMFSLGALLLISRLHLQRAFARWDRIRVEYPEWLSLQAAQFTLVLTVVMVVIAWQVPLGKQADAIDSTINYVTKPIEEALEPLNRLVLDLAGGGGNFHKFGRTLPIRGDISLGSRILFEVRGEHLGLVRGTSYDYYTGSGWRSSNRNEQEVNAGTPTSADIQARTYRDRIVTRLDIEVFDDEDTLFSVGTPLGANIDAIAALPDSFPGDIERIRSQEDLQEGDRYRVAGTVSIANPDKLRADSADYPDWIRDRYLQLPNDLPDRIYDETAEVTEGVTNPYDLTLAIQAYLREFEVDTSVRSAPSRRDAVDFLLFDLQRGYFDYFSTAMAVMLRTQGVPARVAVGYVLDPEDFEEGTFSVRKNDAYSWVEVYFPTYGWIDFNPSDELTLVGATFEGLISSTNNEPLPDLPFDLIPLEETINDGSVLLGELLTPVELERKSGPPWMVIWILAGTMGTLVVVSLGTRLYWVWGLRGLRGLPRQWGGIERLAGWAGLQPKESETVRQWGIRLGSTLERPEEASLLSTAFEEARYASASRENNQDGEEADEAYRMLRNALAVRIFGQRSARREQDEGKPNSELPDNDKSFN
ncbi:MAG TPA: hypothetical protein DGL25_00940 [Dehalococcoidia bacterium]|nr:hypothetical protein [Dehalococcoidia bacterium]|tara:strand:- start:3863 stop:6199 length:2337 start_codon:yes stop_codon:yes gene_type:complete